MTPETALKDNCQSFHPNRAVAPLNMDWIDTPTHRALAQLFPRTLFERVYMPLRDACYLSIERL